MSTKEITSLIKMQGNVVDFHSAVYESMKLVRDTKGLRVCDKTEIIAQLELMHRGYRYGFYMNQSMPHRLEPWHDEKQYDNVTHNPRQIAYEMIERYKQSNKATA